jgi:uncharacterized HAD superfamily protein
MDKNFKTMGQRILKVVLDIDGVISTNPQFFGLLTYFLTKKRNRHLVFIVTARNPNRQKETIKWLKGVGVVYEKVFFMPTDLTRDFTTQGNWKKDVVSNLNADLWFDNDFKWYERECGIDFSDLKCVRIEI